MAVGQLSRHSTRGFLYAAAINEALDALGAEMDGIDIVRGDVSDHLEETDEDAVLAAVSDELAEWTRSLEDYQLAKASLAAESQLEALEDAADTDLDHLTTAVVEKVLLPQARRYINSTRDELYGNVLTGSSATGLHQLLPPNFQLQNSAASAVARSMAQQRTAAIGIAGPRGCGKTTLIEWFTQSSPGHRVLVSAPVQYDPRDFVLHLFAEVCHSITGKTRALPSGEAALARPRAVAATVAHVASTFLLRLLVLVAGLAVGLASYLLVQSYGTIPLSSAAVRQAVALVVLAWISLNAASLVGTSRSGIQPFTVMVNHLKAPDRPLVTLSLVSAAGSVAIVVVDVREGVAMADRTFILILVIVTATALGVTCWRLLAWRRLRQPRDFQGIQLDRSYIRDRGAVHDLAEAYLGEIRFQQTFTSGWGGKITASGKLAGAELSNSEGVSLVRFAWTLPETVRNLRDLLEAAARYSPVVIGIDEVDKIEDVEAARRFINDVKAVFHVPGCYYLVSVSDDAVQSFESRGLPFRDAFDSAFDEVVRVESGDVDVSRDILAGRVVGLPVVFSALCHALSGGLPRDLLRTTRYLYSLDQPLTFEKAAPEMAFRELLGKIPFLLRNATRLNSSTASLVVGWSEDTSAAWRGTLDLRKRIEDLEEVMNRVEDDAGLPVESKGSLLRSCAEAEAVALLALTLVEYAERIDGPSVPREPADALGSLAVVRQAIALHPAIAVTRLRQFRQQNGLTPVDSWSRPAEYGDEGC